MKFSRKTAGLILQSFLLLAVVLIVISPVAPPYEPIPARDQGVYLYIGQQILKGDIPYRDVWDHKGPLIYYINALGLWMTGSVWGVWLIQVLFLFLAAISGWLAMQMVFDPLTAFSGTILWLAAFPEVVDHGNSVEEYSLLFQFAAAYFFLRAQKTSKGYWNELLIGMTAALAFSLRPNNIGIHLAIGLVLAAGLFSATERIHTLKRIVWAAAGSGIVFAVIAVYFAAHKALGDLFNQVFIFNYYYSRLETFSWQSITKAYTLMPVLVILSFAGLTALTVRLYRDWKQKIKADKTILAFFLLTAVPIQIYLSLLSGRKYMHYYIAWLPVLALLTGFLIFSIQQWTNKLFSRQEVRQPLNLVIALGLVITFAAQPISGRLPKIELLSKTVWTQKTLPPPDYSTVERGIYVDYILNHTQPGDYVLIWGNASVYNFLSERESPSRFVYTYAFGLPTYVTQSMTDELMADIAAKKPLILDATAKDKTINKINSSTWSEIPTTQRLVRFIEENYIHVDTIGSDHLRVWIPK
jgi:hypothetical protein